MLEKRTVKTAAVVSVDMANCCYARNLLKKCTVVTLNKALFNENCVLGGRVAYVLPFLESEGYHAVIVFKRVGSTYWV